jgi:hypothetical protein
LPGLKEEARFDWASAGEAMTFEEARNSGDTINPVRHGICPFHFYTTFISLLVFYKAVKRSATYLCAA